MFLGVWTGFEMAFAVNLISKKFQSLGESQSREVNLFWKNTEVSHRSILKGSLKAVLAILFIFYINFIDSFFASTGAAPPSY